uniref:response regulator n=1 Tax=Aliarcobacter sp. TaxID=2321116 RepID=UPI004047E852
MFNNSFLKKLNVLYIENDVHDREHFSSILHKFFNNVIVCSSAEEGISSYLEKKEEFFIDIIICDISLGDSTGIEVLKKIRKIDIEVPFILTTTKIQVDDLLVSIKYKATDFLEKPINGKDLIFCIERVCHNKYHERLKIVMQQDLEDLRCVINEVALVSKTDLEGNITFANSFFCEISQYKEDELIGKNHQILKDEKTSSLIYKELEEKVKSGIIWEGKLKNISKNEKEFYIHLTVLPIYDKKSSKIIEFMWISFLTTDDELEQKEFKKKVVQNMQSNRRINSEAREKIDELMNKISEYSNMKTLLINERQRAPKFISQIEYYEKELIEIEKKLKITSEKASAKIKQVLTTEKIVREKKEEVVSLLNELLSDLENKNKSIKELTIELGNQLKLIKKLMSGIDTIEEMLGLNEP